MMKTRESAGTGSGEQSDPEPFGVCLSCRTPIGPDPESGLLLCPACNEQLREEERRRDLV
jgi:hypothetical protein